MTKRYNEMTEAERLAKWNDLAEASEIHVRGFVSRPYRGTRDDNRAANHHTSLLREMGFLQRVARSCGDKWAR